MVVFKSESILWLVVRIEQRTISEISRCNNIVCLEGGFQRKELTAQRVAETRELGLLSMP
jgi:hypothetical protein